MQKKIRTIFMACFLLGSLSSKAAYPFEEVVAYKGEGYDLRNLSPARKLDYFILSLLPEGPEKVEKLATFFGKLRPFASYCRGGDDPEWKTSDHWKAYGGIRHPWGGACECGSFDPSNPEQDPCVWEKKLQDFNSAKVGLEMLLSDVKEREKQKQRDEAVSEQVAHQLTQQQERERVVSRLIETYQTICALKAEIEVEALLERVKGDFEAADYEALKELVGSTLTQETVIALLTLRV